MDIVAVFLDFASGMYTFARGLQLLAANFIAFGSLYSSTLHPSFVKVGRANLIRGHMAFRSTTQRGLGERERGAAVFQPVARRPRART
jgi:hypothetical protein